MKLNYADIILYDMNKMEVEKEERVDFDKTFKDELDSFIKDKNNYFIKRLGLEITKLGFTIINQKYFNLAILANLYKDYKIIDCQSYGNGHPDFILEKDNEKIFIEIKIDEDSLRESQLKWFIENKDKIGKVLWIYPSLNISNLDLIDYKNSKENNNSL